MMIRFLKRIKFHSRYPKENFGVLGFFTWSPELKITPFMRWLEKSGPQFSYGDIRGIWTEWQKLWTCNISFKKAFLLEFGLFDPDFKDAAWEDVELGYRLSQHGLRILYNKRAIGYHYHPTSFDSVIGRMKKHGKAAVILGQKISEEGVLPPLARSEMGKKIDFLDRLFFTPSVEYLFRKLALWGEMRFNLSIVYDLILLHYRVVGRREFFLRK